MLPVFSFGGMLKVLDLFAGLRGWSEPWEQRGHEVYSIDNDERFDVSSHADILELKPSDLPWRPDVILASPPCNCFSVMTIGRNWTVDLQPKREQTKVAVALAEKTRDLINETQPQFFVIENPRAVLRKLQILDGFERRTVTYCQYGEAFMKPTDLWGGFPPSLELRPMCKPRGECHVGALRGGRTGIQGNAVLQYSRKDGQTTRWSGDVDLPRRKKFSGGMLDDMRSTLSWSEARRELTALRAKIPVELSLAICEAAERDYIGGTNG